MNKQEEIDKEVKRLKGATDGRLEQYNEELTKKRLAWFQSQKAFIDTKASDPIETAYHLLVKKFDTTPEQMAVVRRERNKIVFHSKNFCPTLEACIILGLDTRKVCRLYNERATDTLVKQFDPALRFARNYEKLRPHAPYCEEMIIGDGYDKV